MPYPPRSYAAIKRFKANFILFSTSLKVVTAGEVYIRMTAICMFLLWRCCKRGFLLRRYASRINRFIRLRSAAWGNTFLGTDMATCTGNCCAESVFRCTKRSGFIKKLCPASNSEAIIFLLRSLSAFEKEAPEKTFSFSFPLSEFVVSYDGSFVRNTQFFTSFAAASCKHSPAVFGFHALAEAMLIYSFPL